MRKVKLALALTAAILLAGGCSSTKDLYTPVEAPEITNQFNISEVWSRSTGGVGSFFSLLSPCAYGNVIYAAGRSGDLQAFNAEDGSRIWDIDLDDEEENDDRRSARLSGGVSADAQHVAVGSENGYIYVVNARDGTLAWKAYVTGEVLAKPKFSADGLRLFVLDSRGRVTCYATGDGSVLWVSGDAPTSLRLRCQTDPVVVGDEYLIVGQSNGRVSVMLQSTGAIVNQLLIGESSGATALERMADVSSTPVLSGSSLYTVSYSGNFTEYSFSSNSVVNRLGYRTSRDIAYDEDVIVLVGDDSHIFCINRADYSERWANTRLTYRSVTAPVIYGNYVVVGDYEGYLYFVDLTDGRLVYQEEIDDDGIAAAPLVYDGKLYVSTRSGDLICYSYPQGGVALSKEQALRIDQQYAGTGVSLIRPGVGESGIYAPDSMTREQLEERRQAITQAVARAEAQRRAAEARMMAERREYERQRAEYEQRRAEYEARRQAYEEETRRRISGFGIAPGVRSAVDEAEAAEEAAAAANESAAAEAAPVEQPAAEPVETAPAPDASEKASGFGL